MLYLEAIGDISRCYTCWVSVPTIETKRLRLRPFNLEDSVPLHKILEVEGVLQYFSSPEPPDFERVEKLVQQQIDHWDEHGYGWWAVESQADNHLIGWSGLRFCKLRITA